MWYVRPAKPQITLRLCAVRSEPLLVICHMSAKLLPEYHLEFLSLRTLFVLFDLILYVPSKIIQSNRDRSSWVEPVLS